MGEQLRSLAATDPLTVVLVEHDIAMVTAVCPRVLVLNGGQLIFDGAPEAALRSDTVQEAYLGTAVTVPDEVADRRSHVTRPTEER
jgi:ABC-type branched-subunit amino acid transport system ATPase component